MSEDSNTNKKNEVIQNPISPTPQHKTTSQAKLKKPVSLISSQAASSPQYAIKKIHRDKNVKTWNENGVVMIYKQTFSRFFKSFQGVATKSEIWKGDITQKKIIKGIAKAIIIFLVTIVLSIPSGYILSKNYTNANTCASVVIFWLPFIFYSLKYGLMDTASIIVRRVHSFGKSALWVWVITPFLLELVPTLIGGVLGLIAGAGNGLEGLATLFLLTSIGKILGYILSLIYIIYWSWQFLFADTHPDLMEKFNKSKNGDFPATVNTSPKKTFNKLQFALWVLLCSTPLLYQFYAHNLIPSIELIPMHVTAESKGGVEEDNSSARNQNQVKTQKKSFLDVNKTDRDGCTKLHWAAAGGETKNVKSLIKAGADVNKSDVERCTPLFYISRHITLPESTESEIVKTLIEAGADVNHVNVHGNTALIYAALRGRTEIVKILIESGADVNKANKAKLTPILVAANEGIVDLLIKSGADTNKSDLSLTYAVEKGLVGLLILHIRAGADVNQVDEEGNSLLLLATANNQTGIVKALIAAGADVDKENNEGVTPLLHATARPEHTPTAIVKALIEAGAHVNVVDRLGKTPLFYAALYNKRETVELLQAAGAVKNPLNGNNMQSKRENKGLQNDQISEAESIDSSTQSLNRPESATPAENKGVDNANSNSSTSLLTTTVNLHEAVISGDSTLVKKAIAETTNLEICDSEGHTALMVAALNDRSTAARLLIQAGADINAKSYPYETSVLMMAAMNGYHEVVAELLSAGVRVNETNKSRFTALMLAARGNHREVVIQLLQAGADKHMKDGSGKQAADHTTSPDIRRIITDFQRNEQMQTTPIYGTTHATTILHEAVKSGKPSLVKKAIAETMNLEIRDIDGHTALMVAALKDRSTSARLLIQAGADINAKSSPYETSVLMMAAMNGCHEVVAELIAAGVRVNETNKSQFTALMLAARGNHREVVIQLLQAGADKHMRDGSGKQAADHTTSPDIRRILMENCFSPEPMIQHIR